MMRLRYKVPNKEKIAGKLLSELYDEESIVCAQRLTNKVACMSFDGCSNIKKNPIISTCVTTDDGEVFVAETCNCSGTQQSAENLFSVALECINRTEENFKCKVKSFVTDSCNTMKKLRKMITSSSPSETEIDPEIMAYGCSSHAINHLVHDICGMVEFDEAIKTITKVVKYFRNHQLPKAWYDSTGAPHCRYRQEPDGKVTLIF